MTSPVSRNDAAVSASQLDARLRAGLDAMGLSLEEEGVERLLAYLDLMGKWNRVYNLTRLVWHQRRRGLGLRSGPRGRGVGHEPGCGSGPQDGAGADSGCGPGCRVTVTGMPRRSSCCESQTKIRAR